MSRLIIEIPSDVADAIQLPLTERLPRIQRELALRLYQKGLLSFGKAREMANLTKWEFHELLSSEGIERSYDLEELDTDLMTLEQLS